MLSVCHYRIVPHRRVVLCRRRQQCRRDQEKSSMAIIEVCLLHRQSRDCIFFNNKARVRGENKLTCSHSDGLQRVFTTVLQCYIGSTCKQASVCRHCQQATLCRCRRLRPSELLGCNNCVHSSYNSSSVLLVTQLGEQSSRGRSCS